MKPAAPKALMVGVFGARGTGKTYWCRRDIERGRPARLLMWDHKHDPQLADFGRAYRGWAELPALITAMRAGRFKVRYLPDVGDRLEEQFAIVCQAAFLAGNLVLWVDELPEVTKANGGNTWWRRCVNVGREYTGHDGQIRALTIYGSGQRPGEVDKSFMNNLDVLHTGRIANASDAKTLADFLRVDYRELMDLPDRQWIERRAGMAQPLRSIEGAAPKASAPRLQKKSDQAPAPPKAGRLRRSDLPKP